MGPEEGNGGMGDFSQNVPPSFGGDSNYSQYRNNVLFWVSLTTIPANRQGAALIGRLYGEAKISATTLEVEDICSDNGVDILLRHLDRSYGVDEHNQLNVNISAFMNYSWLSTFTVDQFISGFNARLDRVSCLGFEDSVKGHLLLKLSGLSQSDQNIVVASAGGDYSVKKISTALRNAFQRVDPPAPSMHTVAPAAQPRSVLAHPPHPPHWHDHGFVAGTVSVDAQGGSHSYLNNASSASDSASAATARRSGEYRPRRGRDPPRRGSAQGCRPTFFTMCAPLNTSTAPKEEPILLPHEPLTPLAPTTSTALYASQEIANNAVDHASEPRSKDRDVVLGRRAPVQRADGTLSTELLCRIVYGNVFPHNDIEHAFLKHLCEDEDDGESDESESSEDPSVYVTDSNEESSGSDSDDDSDDEMSDASSCGKLGHVRRGEDDEGDYNPTYMSTFVTFASQHEDGPTEGAIIDSGACTSVVGRGTLDTALAKLKIDKLIDGKPLRTHHQFGPNSDKHPTICSIHFPFWGSDRHEPLFDIQFDVIEGNLPFLVGLPSLVAMKANLNFSYRWLGFKVGEEYLKLALQFLDSHIMLPFRATLKKDDRRKSQYQDKSSYYTPASAVQKTSEEESSDEGRLNGYYTPSIYANRADESSPELDENDQLYYPSTTESMPGNDEPLEIEHAYQEPDCYQKADDAWKRFVCQLHDPATSDARFVALPLSASGESSSSEHNPDNVHYRSTSVAPRHFDFRQLRKIHLHLKHGTASQMQDYLKTAQWWDPALKEVIGKVIRSCPCTLGDGPSPHPITGTRPPTTLKQAHVSVDVITISGVAFLHSVDHGTKWSETEPLRSHALIEQVRAFKVSQLFRHGAPKKVTADGEYCKGAFKDMCTELNIQLITTPGHSHQSNGRIERANRAVRSFYNRLRVCNPTDSTQFLVAEATFTKNMCIGESIASPFELLYGRAPLLTGDDTPARVHPPTIEEAAAHSARLKLKLMTRKNVRKHVEVNVGDMVFIWRDNSGWIGPAPVTEVDPYKVTVLHNNHLKTASRNRVRCIIPRDDVDSDSEPNHDHQGSPHPDFDDEPPRAIYPANSPRADHNGRIKDLMDLGTSEANRRDNPTPLVITASPAASARTDQEDTNDDKATAELKLINERKPASDINYDGSEADKVDAEGEVMAAAPNTDANTTDPFLMHASHADNPIDETNQEGAPVDEADQSEAPTVDMSSSHPNLDRESRQLTDEANRFINSSHGLGRTRSKTGSNKVKSITRSKDITQCSFNSTQGQVSDHSTSSASVDKCGRAPASVSWADTTFVSESNRPLTTEERTASFNKELQVWQSREAFKRIERTDAPAGANIIGSHTVYRRKDDGSAKARIVPWGHRDPARFDLRCDLPCLNPDIFRLTLSIAAEKGWRICQMDAEAAFLQARGFSRAVYVRPPKEANDPTGLWHLLAPAYGLADSGRLWYRTNDEALLHSHHLTRSKYEPTAYFHKSDHGDLDFLLVVQVDNYIYCGTDSELALFEQFLQSQFKIGSLERDSFPVLGCELVQAADGTIDITQKARAANIDTNVLTATIAKKDGDRLATPTEVKAYRSVIGQCLYVGRLTNPVLQYHCSNMADKISALHVRHLKTLKTVVNNQTKNPSRLTFKHTHPSTPFTLQSVSDASMATAEEAARGGFLIFHRNGDVVHPIYWSARKLRRVARSSSTAELLSASDATNALAYYQTLLAEVLYQHQAESDFDSRSLFDLTTTVHEPLEPLNKVDLASIRQLFSPTQISTIAWMPGHYNVSDALTKNNLVTAALLHKTLREGIYPHHPDRLVRTAEQPLLDDEGNLHQAGAC